MENLKKYHNRFVVDTWVHNNGFTSKWLRRISRVSKTQLISDVQYTLRFGQKHNDPEYMYHRSKSAAQRYNIKDGELVERKSHLSNDDGVSTVSFYKTTDDVKCKDSFKDIFETDLREIYPDKNERVRKSLDSSFEIFTEDVKDTTRLEKSIYFPNIVPIDEKHYLGSIVKDLEELFNLPVFLLKIGFTDRIDTTHKSSIIKDNAVHMHINHHGGDKKVLTMSETKDNTTISFWLFDDKVVFQTEGGIESW